MEGKFLKVKCKCGNEFETPFWFGVICFAAIVLLWASSQIINKTWSGAPTQAEARRAFSCEYWETFEENLANPKYTETMLCGERYGNRCWECNAKEISTTAEGKGKSDAGLF